jgi:Protein of unknown function (DUF1493)
MIKLNEIIEFLNQILSIKAKPDSDIFKLGVSGDDFDELILKYSEKYAVDMNGYLWYFNHDEEGLNFPGALFFKPPNCRVKRIPVTPNMLLAFANQKKWGVEYPKHYISEKRYDLLINKAFSGILLIILLLIVIRKYCSQ